MQRGVSGYRPCTICQDNCMLVEVATVTNLGAQEIGCQLALLGTYLKSGVFICYVKKKFNISEVKSGAGNAHIAYRCLTMRE